MPRYLTVPCVDLYFIPSLFINTSHHQLACYTASRVPPVHLLQGNKPLVFCHGGEGTSATFYKDFSHILIFQPHLFPQFQRHLVFPIPESSSSSSVQSSFNFANHLSQLLLSVGFPSKILRFYHFFQSSLLRMCVLSSLLWNYRREK